VKEANVGAVMTAYNLVNGEYAAQHRGLVQGVLRDEWGFDGLVMTDWWSVYDPIR
jgi:beta-glucosidase